MKQLNSPDSPAHGADPALRTPTLSNRLKPFTNFPMLAIGRLRFGNTPKVFCIGRNKSGTTSLKFALRNFGYTLGNQRLAEILYDKHYFGANYTPIIRYCKSYQAFQDVPFSCPDLYRYLDAAFPGSKFILSVRDSSEEWYRSITRSQSKLWGNGALPTYEMLCQARYVRPGFAANIVKLYGTSTDEPYQKEKLIQGYEDHNRNARQYFTSRPDDFIQVNVANSGDFQKLAQFLGQRSAEQDFPWANKT